MQDQHKRKRWLDNMIEAAKHETTAMPWARGARRAAFIAKRKETLGVAA
ncbi:hypothetical protein KO498_07850 [Lentibacter algarum]|nr:hypothetical protein [Lentibacter algarum]MBU2981726.1 hypothetical protein [Lentibacter algarum]